MALKPGGGKAKGSSFEREVCRDLSLWITGNQRSELFTRNIVSGGQFTSSIKAGKDEHGMPGDIMAKDKLAYDFLSCFLVECKHHANLGLEAYLFDTKRTSPLAKIIAKSRREAEHAKVNLMIVAKQNRRDPVVLLEGFAGSEAMRCAPPRMTLNRHTFHNGEMWLFDFQQFRNLVNPTRYIQAMRERVLV